MNAPPTPHHASLKRDAPDAYRALAALTRSAGRLGHGLDELVKIRASIVNGCAYCIDTHSTRAAQEGEDSRRLLALAAWEDSALFSDRERTALALTDALSGAADPATLESALEGAVRWFPDDALTKLVVAIIAINSWNRAARASGFQTQPLEGVVDAR